MPRKRRKQSTSKKQTRETNPMFLAKCALCKEVCSMERQQDGSHVTTVARMLSKDVFWYGMSGEFQFVETLPLKVGDRICLPCMKAHEFVPHLGVECMVCHEKFQRDQCGAGYECSGHVRDREVDGKKIREIGCGYGSHYDMTNFVFVSANHLKVDDLVCDHCIYAMVKAGEVEVAKLVRADGERKLDLDWDG